MSDLLCEFEADSSLLEILVDCTCILDTYPNLKAEDIYLIQFHTVRLCYALHLQDTSGLRFCQGVGKTGSKL